MTNRPIRLGTRASQLALVQSRWVQSELESHGYEVELIELKTEGDVTSGPLAQIGGQGLFTHRLQVGLINDEVDLAVHSLKDLPTADQDELIVAAVPPRENPADVVVVKSDSESVSSIDQLPSAAVIGTGSVRRIAQLLHWRSDLQAKDIRGNVDTRLKKLNSEGYDAIVLAAAGLNRMGLADQISFALPTEKILPAVGQGCLGLEVRRRDEWVIEAVSKLNDPSSFAQAMAERSMLQTLFAGCLSPVGARCRVNGEQLTLTGVVLSTDGKTRIEATESSSLNQATTLGQNVAQLLFEQGAQPLLAKKGE